MLFCFFFFKQKTAYEMRISDWSSEVCSSDLLEIAEAVDAALGALDRKAVEGVAFVKAKFAANDLVLGQRVAVDVDPLDIGARAFADVEGDVHRPRFGIAAELRIDVGKGVAEQARGFAELFDRILRSEEHTSELQSLMRISYAVFCLKKNK